MAKGDQKKEGKGKKAGKSLMEKRKEKEAKRRDKGGK